MLFFCENSINRLQYLYRHPFRIYFWVKGKGSGEYTVGRGHDYNSTIILINLNYQKRHECDACNRQHLMRHGAT